MLDKEIQREPYTRNRHSACVMPVSIQPRMPAITSDPNLTKGTAGTVICIRPISLHRAKNQTQMRIHECARPHVHDARGVYIAAAYIYIYIYMYTYIHEHIGVYNIYIYTYTRMYIYI